MLVVDLLRADVGHIDQRWASIGGRDLWREWWVVGSAVAAVVVWCAIGSRAAYRAETRAIARRAAFATAVGLALAVGVGGLVLHHASLADNSWALWLLIVCSWAAITIALVGVTLTIAVAGAAISALGRGMLGDGARPSFDGVVCETPLLAGPGSSLPDCRVCGTAPDCATASTSPDGKPCRRRCEQPVLAIPPAGPGGERLAPPPDEQRPVLGIALSGGGIRSATFSLGALQALQQRPVGGGPSIFARSEVMATVSGGGYTGTAAQLLRATTADPTRQVFAEGSRELAGLRLRHRYLWCTPHPGHRVHAFREFLTAMVIALAGIAFNIALLLAILHVVARPIGWAANHWLKLGDQASTGWPPGSTLLGALAVMAVLIIVTWVPLPKPAATIARIGAVVIGVTLVVLAMHLQFPETRSQGFAQIGGIVGVLLVVGLIGAIRSSGRDRSPILDPVSWLFLAVPIVLGWVWIDRARRRGVGGPSATTVIEIVLPLVIVTLVAVVVGAVGFAWSARFSIGLRVVGLAALVAGANLAALCWWLTDQDRRSFVISRIATDWEVWLWSVTVLGAIYLVLDQKRWSPHTWYKRRLSYAFAHEVDDEGTGRQMPWRTATTLSRLGARQLDGPELVICAAAYDTSSPALARPVQPYTFSARHVGGPWLGYCRTVDFEAALGKQNAPDGTLLAAMAISGAAVSPAIGQTDMGAASTLISIVNGRLGVWLPNPQYVNRLRARDVCDEPPVWLRLRRVNYLVKEVLRGFHPDGRFVYVTDGGQFDNLGLLELLRRGCTTIVVIDATGDNAPGKPITTRTFTEVVKLAWHYHGVELAPEGPTELERLTKLKGVDAQWEKGSPAPHVDDAVATIRFRYPTDPTDSYPNTIVIGKAVITEKLAKELADNSEVRAFLERSPAANRFPADSTINQFLGDDQFEAYRLLGERVGESVVERTRAVLAEQASSP